MDKLKPARGVIYGLIISALIWLVIIVAIIGAMQ
jgi:hypothetical protein